MYIFVLSPNNSGTTVIGQYIAAQSDGYLPPFGNHEGQMVPAVKEAMRSDPWNPEARLDWPFIKSVWDELLAESGKGVFVETSPPNLMRVGQIREAFAEDARYLFSIANPYAQISSCIYNYSDPPLAPRTLRRLTEQWLNKARAMAQNIVSHPDIPKITYEDFCRTPTVINEALDLPVVSDSAIAGKRNAPVTRIMDMTNRNILFNDAFTIDRISELLAEEEDLLQFFGYSLIEDGVAFVTGLKDDFAALHAALIRRSRWEAKGRKGGI